MSAPGLNPQQLQKMGGYSRKEGNDRLRRSHGVIASFSRGLVEGLSAQQSDSEFNARLDGFIQSIFEASTVKQEPVTRMGVEGSRAKEAA